MDRCSGWAGRLGRGNSPASSDDGLPKDATPCFSPRDAIVFVTSQTGVTPDAAAAPLVLAAHSRRLRRRGAPLQRAVRRGATPLAGLIYGLAVGGDQPRLRPGPDPGGPAGADAPVAGEALRARGRTRLRADDRDWIALGGLVVWALGLTDDDLSHAVRDHASGARLLAGGLGDARLRHPHARSHRRRGLRELSRRPLPPAGARGPDLPLPRRRRLHRLRGDPRRPAAQAYLGAVFAALAEPVRRNAGSTDDYIGDMAMITWPMARGLKDARCVACVFDVLDGSRPRPSWHPLRHRAASAGGPPRRLHAIF